MPGSVSSLMRSWSSLPYDRRTRNGGVRDRVANPTVERMPADQGTSTGSGSAARSAALSSASSNAASRGAVPSASQACIR